MPHPFHDRLRIGETTLKRKKRNIDARKVDRTRTPKTKFQDRVPQTPGTHPTVRPQTPKVTRAEPTPSRPEQRQPKHPLQLPGMPKANHSKVPTPKDKPNRPSEPQRSPQTAKAPASGQMSFQPEKETPQAQRGSVISSVESTSGKQISNFISGSEAIRRAKTSAEKKELDRLLYGINR